MGDTAELKAIKEGTLDEEGSKYKKVNYKFINGKKVTVLKMKDSSRSTKMPLYTNTSDVLLMLNKEDEPIQMSYYNTTSHQRIKDFDWNHNHGKDYLKYDLHIHYYLK